MTDPRTFIVAETLRDGTAVSIRAIRPDDKRRVFEAFANLDRKSVFTRFFNKTSANLCGKAQYRVGYNEAGSFSGKRGIKAGCNRRPHLIEGGTND